MIHKCSFLALPGMQDSRGSASTGNLPSYFGGSHGSGMNNVGGSRLLCIQFRDGTDGNILRIGEQFRFGVNQPEQLDLPIRC